MNRTKGIILIASGVLFLVLLVLIIILHNRNSTGIIADTPSPTRPNPSETDASPEQTRTREVTLLYLSNRSYRFVPQKAELTLRERKEDLFRDFLKLLLTRQARGLIKPVPDDVRLRTLYYFQEEKSLVLDLATSEQFSLLQGTKAELEFIYFFVNNLWYNFRDEIQEVKLLLNGNEITPLTGHIDTIEAFSRDFSHFAF